ncbi:MAG: tetratricopeptide repeat protein [Candidatus Latescibacteria bacterium]|nr:tetratricopeptide repeat protein [Candidatus Latescibacterota bacterium]NIM21704.1 tetratricopeptide repeat protein [Candidatus Latescibacterota bacterium]NIM65731.1 tetratricopeptide repeat protein [Candidatus Latescibacterota bacterium]NIO02117.1 tetratricopeptide repeat protein [Candidatus Latescibacterota bacterium]NIO28934.1 tetratricopeptide repeat protein [Candidatus Latescibacterota bacterium]
MFLHRVENGETLQQIADDYYGDPKRAEDLKEYNDLSGETLSPGAFIHIPLNKSELKALKRREEARAPYNQGLELVARGSYVDAVRKFQSALEIDPEFVDARYNLGVTYQNMKAYDKALVQYKEVARLRRQNPTYLFATGYCLFHMNNHEKAVKWFEKALEVDPEHARAQYSLAVTYEKMGQDREAIRAWRRYLEIDGDSEWAIEARKRLKKLEQ